MSNIEGDSIFDIFRHHAVSQEPLSLTLKEGLYVSPPPSVFNPKRSHFFSA